VKSYWHFARILDGKPIMRDGTPIIVGKRYEIDDDPIMRKRGFHGSLRAIDALDYAPGTWVSKRFLEGIVNDKDKVVGKAFVQQPGFDASAVLRKFARLCALDVIDSWDAPEVIAHYLRTGYESTEAYDAAWTATRNATWAAAWDAAWDVAWTATRNATWDVAWTATKNATWAAAWDAAWAATRNATWVTERSKQNARLTRMLNVELRKVGARRK